jgi:PKD repeat protein
MKKLFYALFITGLVSISTIFAQSHNPGDYVPNQIMVMLVPGNSIDDVLKDLNDDGLVGQYRLKQVLSKRYRIYLIEHDEILGDSKDLVYDINKMDEVAIAQLDHYVADRLAPNDPNYTTDQWSMNNLGGGGGTADADIDAPEAWNITTGGVTAGGDTIVVAIVDGGVQATHPDLAPNMWKNYIEIAGVAGVDDDGNGYIDDFNGWDAVGNDNVIPSNSHATHCAGIAGARGNNATGVAGVNWNVKILNVKGSTSSESVAIIAYDYCASLRELYNNTNGSAGAFVVATSSSFGIDNGQPSSYPLWCAMYDTLGAVGILSAGAGPNNNVNIDVVGDIPTTCPSNYLIAVTNTTNTDARNGSCGYGPINIDIGAPGTNIYSTYTTSTYNTLTGTSMATPHVAGTIGLYWSAACLPMINDYKLDPGALALQMKTYILTGVDSIASMATTTLSQGRLNLHKGILKVQSYNCSGLPPTATFTVNDQSVCEGTLVNYADASTNSPSSWNWSFPGGSPSSSTTQNPSVTYNTAGTYNAQLIATNGSGSDTILFTSYITVNAIPAAATIIDNAGTLQSSYTGSGNQWYLNGSPIGGAINDTYTPIQDGNYTCVYTDGNGCSSAVSNSIVYNVGIADVSINFSIYPNPATDKLVIDAGATIKANITLTDLSGRAVMNIKMNQSLQQIDVSTLADGVYMIKIEYGNKSVTRKIVKH